MSLSQKLISSATGYMRGFFKLKKATASLTVAFQPKIFPLMPEFSRKIELIHRKRGYFFSSSGISPKKSINPYNSIIPFNLTLDFCHFCGKNLLSLKERYVINSSYVEILFSWSNFLFYCNYGIGGLN